MKKLLGVFVLIQLTALLFPSIIVAQSNQKEIVLEIEKREKLSQVFKLLEKASAATGCERHYPRHPYGNCV